MWAWRLKAPRMTGHVEINAMETISVVISDTGVLERHQPKCIPCLGFLK